MQTNSFPFPPGKRTHHFFFAFYLPGLSNPDSQRSLIGRLTISISFEAVAVPTLRECFVFVVAFDSFPGNIPGQLRLWMKPRGYAQWKMDQTSIVSKINQKEK
ncbi:hypothetical protein ACMFMG_008138 [Clarireedia jacksonii]